MNIFTFSFYIPLLASTLFSAPPALADDATTNGSITFIYDQEEGECTIPIGDKTQIAISHGSEPTPEQPCKGHSIRYIQFNQVRSAVTVWLGSEHDTWHHAIGCPSRDNAIPNNFLFELRTVTTVTNNTPIALDSLTDGQVGQVLIPGVRLMSRLVWKPNYVNRELSCIKIKFN
jgi:hypothetical protein